VKRNVFHSGFLFIVSLLILISACVTYRHNGRPRPEDYLLDYYKELENTQSENEKDERIQSVYRFAPVIRHSTRPCWYRSGKKDESFRTNFITDYDYDGDKNCNNNRDHLMKKSETGYDHDLGATVYYSIVETRTHGFITYHFYHVADRSMYFPNILGLFNLSHENDGENIQLVVRKSESGDYIELIAIESHIRTEICAPDYFDVIPLKMGKVINKRVKLVDCDGRSTTCKDLDKTMDVVLWKQYLRKYSHPAVYIKSGKHGISTGFSRKRRSSDIYFYPPLSPGSRARHATSWQSRECRRYEYKLKPIRKTLWHMYVHNCYIGNNGVMDGYFRFSDEKREVVYKRVPRHYHSNHIACVFLGFKSNSGLLPFSFDLPGKLIKRGRLFFNPASSYRKYLKIDPGTSNWSEDYVYNPYLPRKSWIHKN
jgi:hypothetical protein